MDGWFSSVSVEGWSYLQECCTAEQYICMGCSETDHRRGGMIQLLQVYRIKLSGEVIQNQRFIKTK